MYIDINVKLFVRTMQTNRKMDSVGGHITVEELIILVTVKFLRANMWKTTEDDLGRTPNKALERMLDEDQLYKLSENYNE